MKVIQHIFHYYKHLDLYTLPTNLKLAEYTAAIILKTNSLLFPISGFTQTIYSTYNTQFIKCYTYTHTHTDISSTCQHGILYVNNKNKLLPKNNIS